MPILIDYNQCVIACCAIAQNNHPNPDLKIARHMILDSIVSLRQKFKDEYGEIVICSDSGSYWRKDKFPYYKARRKEIKENSYIDFELVNEARDTVFEELTQVFPYKTLRIDNAEADDIIAILCKYHSENELQTHGLIKTPQKVMIVSTDGDFRQLQKYPNVEQYDPRKRMRKVCEDPDAYLREHLIRGDSGDGIPNILSDDDTLVNPAKRQKRITAKILEQYMNVDIDQIENDNIKRNIQRNNMLINLLESVPEDIEKEIVYTYTSDHSGSRGRLLTYFTKNRLNVLLEKLDQF
jgi:hypothetical protein